MWQDGPDQGRLLGSWDHGGAPHGNLMGFLLVVPKQGGAPCMGTFGIARPVDRMAKTGLLDVGHR